jgi:DNA-binding LytR/AlgR family response regulator
MEEFLIDFPFLVRCHRAFIVNTFRIEKIKGLKLWLTSTETAIPISKTYKDKLQLK